MLSMNKAVMLLRLSFSPFIEHCISMERTVCNWAKHENMLVRLPVAPENAPESPDLPRA